MTRQFQLAKNIDLASGQRAVVHVEERSIALSNVDGVIYAIDDSCPSGSSLASGKLDGCTVQCPAHRLRFDLATDCMHHGAGLADADGTCCREKRGGTVLCDQTQDGPFLLPPRIAAH